MISTTYIDHSYHYSFFQLLTHLPSFLFDLRYYSLLLVIQYSIHLFHFDEYSIHLSYAINSFNSILLTSSLINIRSRSIGLSQIHRIPRLSNHPRLPFNTFIVLYIQYEIRFLLNRFDSHIDQYDEYEHFHPYNQSISNHVAICDSLQSLHTIHSLQLSVSIRLLDYQSIQYEESSIHFNTHFIHSISPNYHQ